MKDELKGTGKETLGPSSRTRLEYAWREWVKSRYVLVRLTCGQISIRTWRISSNSYSVAMTLT